MRQSSDSHICELQYLLENFSIRWNYFGHISYRRIKFIFKNNNQVEAVHSHSRKTAGPSSYEIQDRGKAGTESFLNRRTEKGNC